MTKVFTQGLLCLLFCAAALMAADKNVFDFTLNSIDGSPTPLGSFKGKVVMLVNVPAAAALLHSIPRWRPSMKNTRTAAS